MIWREPTNHTSNYCLWCLQFWTEVSKKNIKSVKYPNISSAMQPVLHGNAGICNSSCTAWKFRNCNISCLYHMEMQEFAIHPVPHDMQDSAIHSLPYGNGLPVSKVPTHFPITQLRKKRKFVVLSHKLHTTQKFCNLHTHFNNPKWTEWPCLIFPKNNPGLLGSRLQQWNLLTNYNRISVFQNCQKLLVTFLYQEGDLSASLTFLVWQPSKWITKKIIEGFSSIPSKPVIKLLFCIMTTFYLQFQSMMLLLFKKKKLWKHWSE